MPELLSQSEYAAHRRCSRAAVHKAIKAGRIELTPDGLIDPVAADAAWLRNSRARVRPGSRAAPKDSAPPPPGEPAPGEPAPYDESRARREQAEASLAELQLGEQNGRLLSRERVERGAFEAARMLRDQLSSCAGSLGALLAGMTSAQECEAEIRREHRHLLDSFVREITRTIGPVEPAPSA